MPESGEHEAALFFIYHPWCIASSAIPGGPFAACGEPALATL